MRYVSEEELRKWILKEGCDDGCGYIDECDLEQMQWEEEPFINLPCISTGVCREHKDKVLDKIRAEILSKAHSGQWSDVTMYGMIKTVAIIDKYRAESEG